MDCSRPGSSIHGILQARILEWVAISFSRRSSQPRDWTQVSRIVGRHFTIWDTQEKVFLNSMSCSGHYLILSSLLQKNIMKSFYLFLQFLLYLYTLQSGIYHHWNALDKTSTPISNTFLYIYILNNMKHWWCWSSQYLLPWLLWYHFLSFWLFFQIPCGPLFCLSLIHKNSSKFYVKAFPVHILLIFLCNLYFGVAKRWIWLSNWTANDLIYSHGIDYHLHADGSSPDFFLVFRFECPLLFKFILEPQTQHLRNYTYLLQNSCSNLFFPAWVNDATIHPGFPG